MNLLIQNSKEPLFPDMLWSRPENKRYGGKLLIVGGQAGSLGAPAKSFEAALAAGIGTARVVLPNSTQKILGKSFLEAEFAASNRSGSFGQAALGQILDASDWADAVLLAGDFGKNSETVILLEKFISKYNGFLVLAGDSVEPFLENNSPVNSRPKTLLVMDFSKLQKLARSNFPLPPLLNSVDITKMTEILGGWTGSNNVGILTEHTKHIVVSLRGQSSSTEFPTGRSWQVELPAYAATWRLQQPLKPFDAITTAVWDYINPSP